MPDQSISSHDTRPHHIPSRSHRRLGRHLIDNHAIQGTDLLRALVLQRHQNAPLGHILISQGLANQDQVLDALSQQHGLQRVDLSDLTPNIRLLNRKPAQFWLRHRAIPWKCSGSQLIIAIAHPEHLDTLKNALHGSFDSIRPVLASEEQIVTFLTAHLRKDLALRANTRIPMQDSSRHLHQTNSSLAVIVMLPVLIGATVFAPRVMFTAMCALSLLALSLFVGLKTFGFVTHLAQRKRSDSILTPNITPRGIRRLPRISMLVPLYHESEISKALLRRLKRLTYPRSLLEVILVLEEHDKITRTALTKATLPQWVKIIEVPQCGTLTTKPRAMNYALDFCHGDIIGVWDAEDAPARGQLEQVARRFESAGADVACLQGVLDYYNPRTNWLSRCFTLEYASWFRIVLPGIARLGLVIPLGGTTLFVKRDALDQLGGWDAHNVTEDADLGVRLYRAGYRTEMIETATHEEANCQPWPWIRQRSRWLKGFMVTYLVHMRRPKMLLAQLGVKRFLGFQAFFLGSVGQFLLAPFLWSFWLILLGLPHPSAALLPAGVLFGAALLLVTFELLGIGIAITAAFASNRRSLALWAPTLIFYFPLGAIAAYKALRELIWQPFFWDKTTHGHSGAEPSTQPALHSSHQ
ncbi:glycosyl transferase [Sedimentitalea sp. CY04]|uniref:Glycosyl transferase n=1 Tax=Parasedimentitalea denitrificans TaxID=2211118 RepID=A0ABX0W8D0_9RHOB|nr:glycosyltransferase family 2 protein [Sedimentitalea sp. CY04]NIZ61503.1 glycosyl transferase [Sedimentitalea sp. CY04]